MILLNDVSGRLVFKNAVRLRRARRGDNVGFALIRPAATFSPSGWEKEFILWTIYPGRRSVLAHGHHSLCPGLLSFGLSAL
jgi:hypothetical protein